jgi:hypothetical protein
VPWKPTEPGELPTLGYIAIDWMSAYLAAPDKADYEPFVPYREQEDFLLRWYQLDPVTGRFVYHRGLLGRPRGWGKSPLLAGISAVEALAPICFAGWDADGQPVGRPWRDIKTPNVHIGAVSEEQTRNTWEPLLQMLDGPVQYEYAGLEPMETQVNLPEGRGKILQRTSAARTIKGGRPIFAVLDQTEEWVPSNGGPRLANTIRNNAAKVGGRTLESPNAFIPGEESVAEKSAEYAESIMRGLARETGLLYDHREAPATTDLSDKESLIEGLRVAYGDSSGDAEGCIIHDPSCEPGHVDLDRLVQSIWDPASDVQVSRSDFLNQITHASDQWIDRPTWRSRMNLDRAVQLGDQIVLGFDGSRGRNRGKADATALIGVRINDGHAFKVRIWEQPPGAAGKDWVPNVIEVDAELAACFDRYRVMGLYADPSGWATQVAAWEARYGRRLRVKAHQQSPIAVWPRGKDSRVVEYVERLRLAIINGEMSHDGDGDLERHVINARTRETKTGRMLFKAFPDSPNKIDGAYALTMAWKARTDALAQGIGRSRTRGKVTVLR